MNQFYVYTYTSPPSHPHPTALGRHRASSRAPCAIRQVPTSYLTRLKRLSSSSIYIRGFPGGSDSKKFACSMRDLGLIPGSGRSPGEGNGNPLQYACQENSKCIYECQCYFLNFSHPLLPLLCPKVHSLCLCLYSCPANKFNFTIFLDFSYMG